MAMDLAEGRIVDDPWYIKLGLSGLLIAAVTYMIVRLLPLLIKLAESGQHGNAEMMTGMLQSAESDRNRMSADLDRIMTRLDMICDRLVDASVIHQHERISDMSGGSRESQEFKDSKGIKT